MSTKKKIFISVSVLAVLMLFISLFGVLPKSARAESESAVKIITAKTDKWMKDPDVILSFGNGWDGDYAVSAKQGDIDYYSAYKGNYWMQFDSPILKVYEIKVVDSETGLDIVNVNDNIEITLQVPDNLVGQKFDIRRCNYTFQKEAAKMDYTLSEDGRYATFTTDEMRPFMVVCDGESLLIPIIVALVLVVGLGALLILQLYKKAKKRKAAKQESEKLSAVAVAPLMLTFFSPSHTIVFAILCVSFVALAILNLIFFTIGRKIPDEEPEEEKADEDGKDEESGEEKTEEKPVENPDENSAPEKKEEKEPEKPEEKKDDNAKEEPVVIVDTAKAEEPKVTPAPAPVIVATEKPAPKKSDEKVKRDRSFIAKLIQSSPEEKKRYSDIKNKLLAIEGTESRANWACDIISTDEIKLAEIRIVEGKVYALYALGEGGKMVKADTDTGVNALCRKYGLKKGAAKRDDYYMPYLDDAELEKRGLIK